LPVIIITLSPENTFKQAAATSDLVAALPYPKLALSYFAVAETSLDNDDVPLKLTAATL